MSSRTIQTTDNSKVKQNEDGVTVLLEESITFDNLKDEVTFGLLPAGTVIALMPHMVDAWQPGASGIVKDGLMLCDGAAIPAGNTLIGTTPDINGSSYLKGATSSTIVPSLANLRSFNVPEIAVHSHPITIANQLVPHNHPSTLNTITISHNHTATFSTADAPHTHPAHNTLSTNTPHGHATNNSPANAPHFHPGTMYSVPSNHNHPDSLTGTGYGVHRHGHRVTSNEGPGPGVRVDFNNQVAPPMSRYSQGEAIPNTEPHNHPNLSSDYATALHTHPISAGATNAPHSHTFSSVSGNMPHRHPITTGANNVPHSHPQTVGTSDSTFDHTHPYSLTTDTVPHSHPGTISGNTGSGDTFNFEPKYMNAIYVIRVR
jgi:hypothetical protein